MLRALKERDFALLWSGQTVSSLGDGIFTIALALEALHIDPHPSGLAFVLAARAVPSVCLALVGGVVVDRVPRRMAMLVSDVVRGVAVASIAVLVATGALHLWAPVSYTHLDVYKRQTHVTQSGGPHPPGRRSPITAARR